MATSVLVHRLPVGLAIGRLIHRFSTTTTGTGVEFTDTRVQEYISRLNRIDFDKIFTIRPGEGSLPQFRLLSQEMVKKEYYKAREECKRLLTPPTLLSTVREEGGHVIVTDKELDKFDDSNWVFTDISMEIDDKDRYIVVREPEGTLRQATAIERDRLCQTYVPKPGRKIWLPKLLTETELPLVLERHHHVHVLDVLCVQCPVDSPDYIRVHDTVYEDIVNKGLYSLIYSTRYYGGLVWYILQRKHLEGIIQFMLKNERLEEIESFIKLYFLVYPKEEGHLKSLTGQELIKKFFEHNGYTNLSHKLTTILTTAEAEPQASAVTCN